MKIIVRCDSSLQIGTGHVMRCLSLANLLRKKGLNITFLCRELDGNHISSILEKQFKVISLPKGEGHIDLETDELAVIEHEKPDWVILDHYFLSETWEEHAIKIGIKLFIIDDLLRKHHCHAILDQNFHSDSTPVNYISSCPKENLLLGPQYALLSQEYFDMKIPRRQFAHLSKGLVFFGGTDPKGASLNFLNIIPSNFKSITWQLVIGRSNPHLNQIQNLSKSLPNVELIIQTARMNHLLSEADFFLGSGGTVTWERCYLGLPAICISVASNQTKIAQDLANSNIHKYLGESHILKDETYVNEVRLFLENKPILEQFSKNSLNLEVASKTNQIREIFEKQA